MPETKKEHLESLLKCLSSARESALDDYWTEALNHLDDAIGIIVAASIEFAKDKPQSSSYSDPPHLRTGLGGCTSGLCAA